MLHELDGHLFTHTYVHMYVMLPKQNCKQHQYHTREQFLTDLNQVVENSITYNGPSSSFTQTAEKMKSTGVQALDEVRHYHYVQCTYMYVCLVHLHVRICDLATDLQSLSAKAACKQY